MATLTVMQWQRVLVFTDGKLDRVLEPGRHTYSRRHGTLKVVDLRSQTMQVPGQQLITADSATISVSYHGRWRVDDPVAFICEAQDPQKGLYVSIQDAARSVVEAHPLEELLADRAKLTEGVLDRVAESVRPFGIRLETIRAKDLMLPGELRRAAMELVTAKEQGRAALERARAEAAALRSLKNTAALLEQHPVLLELRTLQVAADAGSTVVIDPRQGGSGRPGEVARLPAAGSRPAAEAR